MQVNSQASRTSLYTYESHMEIFNPCEMWREGKYETSCTIGGMEKWHFISRVRRKDNALLKGPQISPARPCDLSNMKIRKLNCEK